MAIDFKDAVRKLPGVDEEAVETLSDGFRTMAHMFLLMMETEPRARNYLSIRLEGNPGEFFDMTLMRVAGLSPVDRADQLAAAVERLESHLEEADAERDARVEQIEAIHDALGCEGEWTNLHDLGTCAVEQVSSLIAEVTRLRAQIAQRDAEVVAAAWTWRWEPTYANECVLQDAIDALDAPTHPPTLSVPTPDDSCPPTAQVDPQNSGETQ